MKGKAFIRIIGYFFLVLFFSQCSLKKTPKDEFSKASLQQIAYDSKCNKLSLETILHSLRNKTTVIYLWASWCPECNENLAFLDELKKKYQDDITILFLSIDRTFEVWKKHMKDIKIKGIHFYLGNDLNAPFSKSIKLDWIPRYIILGKDNKIKLFNSETYTDKRIIETLDMELNSSN